MSNYDLLTKPEADAAAAQGWSLSHVYDLVTNKWRVQVVGMPSAELAGLQLVARARMGDALSIKALRLVQASHQGV
jgi:hypothetical protein